MKSPALAAPFPVARLGGLVGVVALAVLPLFERVADGSAGIGIRIVEHVMRDGLGGLGWLMFPLACGVGTFVAAMVVAPRRRVLRWIGLAAVASTGVLLFGIHQLSMEQAVRSAWGIYAAVAAAHLVVVDGWLAGPRAEVQPRPANSDAAVRALVAELERDAKRRDARTTTIS